MAKYKIEIQAKYNVEIEANSKEKARIKVIENLSDYFINSCLKDIIVGNAKEVNGGKGKVV
jgi:hypothetical protein